MAKFVHFIRRKSFFLSPAFNHTPLKIKMEGKHSPKSWAEFLFPGYPCCFLSAVFSFSISPSDFLFSWFCANVPLREKARNRLRFATIAPEPRCVLRPVRATRFPLLSRYALARR
jgi:hypothetical protein